MKSAYTVINNVFYLKNSKALKLLRNEENVGREIEQIMVEINSAKTQDFVSIWGLIKNKEFRWPLITSLGLVITQQISGINAVIIKYCRVIKAEKKYKKV
jgi:hypothetical protein